MAAFLPALVLQQIFQEIEENLPNRYQTLYSCILVNRYWCRNAITFLWRRPFNCSSENFPMVLRTYLQFIDSQELENLNLDINLPVFEKPLLFQYPSFIKHIDFGNFIDAIQSWMTIDADFKKGKNRQNWKPQWFHRELPITQERFYTIKQTFFNALVQSFIQNSARIQSIDMRCDSQQIKDNPEEILWPFEKNVSSLVSNVTNLSVSGMFPKQEVFTELTKVCTKIKTMSITIEGNVDNFGLQADAEYENLGSLIESQKSLSSLELTFREKSRDYINLFLPSIWKNSKSLRNLCFYTADFRDIKSLVGLATCHQLESLEFRYCKGLTRECVVPFATASHPNLKRVRILGGCCQNLTRWAETKNKSNY